jgi:hypothetical protein
LKRYKLTLTTNQIKILMMAIQEAIDGNSYQDNTNLKGQYDSIVSSIDKLSNSIYKQFYKQGYYNGS